MEEEFEVKRFEDVKEGDVLIGPDGEEVTVLREHEKHIPETMYEIELENGEKIKASGNHLWYIESEFHKSNYRNRVKEARKFLKQLTPEMVDQLKEISERDEEIETSLIDMLALIEETENRTAFKIFSRIASSLGPISENTASLQDMITGETMPLTNVPHYDAKQFSQQVLSLSNKKYAKNWPIIKGEVVTTEQLLDFYEEVDIPTIKEVDK